MGRLIDTDRLNKDFNLIITHIENSNKETISKKEFLDCLKILRECVDEQPTAYDVDNVVEDIRKQFGCKDCEYADTFPTPTVCSWECAELEVINDLCDIVKRGGVDNE